MNRRYLMGGLAYAAFCLFCLWMAGMLTSCRVCRDTYTMPDGVKCRHVFSIKGNYEFSQCGNLKTYLSPSTFSTETTCLDD